MKTNLIIAIVSCFGLSIGLYATSPSKYEVEPQEANTACPKICRDKLAGTFWSGKLLKKMRDNQKVSLCDCVFTGMETQGLNQPCIKDSDCIGYPNRGCCKGTCQERVKGLISCLPLFLPSCSVLSRTRYS